MRECRCIPKMNIRFNMLIMLYISNIYAGSWSDRLNQRLSKPTGYVCRLSDCQAQIPLKSRQSLTKKMLSHTHAHKKNALPNQVAMSLTFFKITFKPYN